MGSTKGKKIIRYSTLFIAMIIAFLALFPLLFQDSISQKIKAYANDVITGELDYQGISLSFFRHFPNLTISVDHVQLKGAPPFQQDTLLSVREIAFGVDLFSLFSDRLKIKKIHVLDGKAHILVDSTGKANYNIYVPEQADTSANAEPLDIRVASIRIKDIDLVYDDASLPLYITAEKLNYTGKGDLESEIFDLTSRIRIARMDLFFNGDQYLKSKKIDAELVTTIDTKSLRFGFHRNNLRINQLPIRFKGDVAILSNGYHIDFIIGTRDAKLKELLSLLPERFIPWLDNTRVGGNIDMFAALKGRYNAETHQQPDLEFGFKVQQGKLQHKQAASAIEALELRFKAKVPQLDQEQLDLQLDTLSFRVGADHFRANAHIHGLSRPEIQASIEAALDLAKTQKALGIQAADTKGRLELSLTAHGRYAEKTVPKGLRDSVTIIEEIPHFDLAASVKNGYFHYKALPLPIEKINFNIRSGNKTGRLDDSFLNIRELVAETKGNFLRGHLKIDDLRNFPMDILLQADIRLEQLKDMFPIDSFDFGGHLSADLLAKGRYAPDQKLFPLTQASLQLQNGHILTPYFPRPVEDIQIRTHLTSTGISLKDIRMEVEPISFTFEEQPFILQADLSNLDDIRYDIVTRGTIQIGKLYRVFAIDGMDIDGVLKTDLSLKGLQSDAMQGRYTKLNNQGTIKMEKIAVRYEEFPLPFFIREGLLEIDQDQIHLKGIQTTYGQSDLAINGTVSNVTGYLLEEQQPLKGKVNLASKYLLIEELKAFAQDSSSSESAKESTGTGVLLIPENLLVDVITDVQKVDFLGNKVDNLKAVLKLKQGNAILEKSEFVIAGTRAALSAAYAPSSPVKADFTFDIQADNFDIQKVYKEVPLFKELVSSASYAKGIASINYILSGVLDDQMSPILPSLKGSGEIRIRDAQLMNFKLMNAVSRATQRDSLTNPNVKDVVIKTAIRNNIITLERTKLKIFGFRPRFEGQVSLDGDLNLKGRLGLPPFGIIGIPFHVTGNSENPKVRLRKAKKNDSGLEEVEYDEDPEDTDSENIDADN